MNQADLNDGYSTDDNSIGGRSILLERLDFRAPVYESVIRNKRISIIGAGAFGRALLIPLFPFLPNDHSQAPR